MAKSFFDKKKFAGDLSKDIANLRTDILGDDLEGDDLFGDELFGDLYDQIAVGDDLTGDPLIDALSGNGDISADAFGDPFDLAGDDLTGSPLIKTALGKLTKMASNNPSFINKAKRIAGTIKKRAIKGELAESASFPHVMVENGKIVQFATRNTIKGDSIRYALQRYETEYPGTSRVLIGGDTGTAKTGTDFFNWTFTFDGTNGIGSLTNAMMILVNIQVSPLNVIPSSEISLYFTAKTTSNYSVNVPSQTNPVRFTMFDKKPNVGILILPFIEVASILQPVILQANGTNNLEIHLNGVPSQAQVIVTLLGRDHYRYEAFKKKYGFSPNVKNAIIGK